MLFSCFDLRLSCALIFFPSLSFNFFFSYMHFLLSIYSLQTFLAIHSVFTRRNNVAGNCFLKLKGSFTLSQASVF